MPTNQSSGDGPSSPGVWSWQLMLTLTHACDEAGVCVDPHNCPQTSFEGFLIFSIKTYLATNTRKQDGIFGVSKLITSGSPSFLWAVYLVWTILKIPFVAEIQSRYKVGLNGTYFLYTWFLRIISCAVWGNDIYQWFSTYLWKQKQRKYHACGIRGQQRPIFLLFTPQSLNRRGSLWMTYLLTVCRLMLSLGLSFTTQQSAACTPPHLKLEWLSALLFAWDLCLWFVCLFLIS